MTAALLTLLLAAPGEKTHWSEAHGVGVALPGTWTIVAKDDGDRAFVVDGPQLGPGIPRAVLWYAGPAAARTLDDKAEQLRAQVSKREGWAITATVRKTVGPFPCVRMALTFREPGKAKGRARFTVALLGGNYYVLELSAAASHFPAKTFDRIEQSLQVKWQQETWECGITLEAPPGWKLAEGGGGGAIEGPRRGRQPTLILLSKEREMGPAPETARPGPKLRFHRELRETMIDERAIQDEEQRMLVLNAEGWTVVVRMPVDAWEDLFPVAEEIVRRAKLAAEDG